MPAELLDYNAELWHAPVGAYLAEKEAGITDPEILDAIRYHTSGRPGMTLLDKVIYVADYIEPGRHFPGVEEVRRLAETDLNEALIQAMKNTMIFLMKKTSRSFRRRLQPIIGWCLKIDRRNLKNESSFRIKNRGKSMRR